VTVLVNLTPHPVNLVTDGGTVVVPPSGLVARVALHPDVPVGTVELDGVTVPIVATSASGDVTGLPEQRDGVLVVVSRLVAEVSERADLVIPHDAVRDATGAVVGCRALARVR
jgi:hypothetical protein